MICNATTGWYPLRAQGQGKGPAAALLIINTGSAGCGRTGQARSRHGCKAHRSEWSAGVGALTKRGGAPTAGRKADLPHDHARCRPIAPMCGDVCAFLHCASRLPRPMPTLPYPPTMTAGFGRFSRPFLLPGPDGRNAMPRPLTMRDGAATVPPYARAPAATRPCSAAKHSSSRGSCMLARGDAHIAPRARPLPGVSMAPTMPRQGRQEAAGNKRSNCGKAGAVMRATAHGKPSPFGCTALHHNCRTTCPNPALLSFGVPACPALPRPPPPPRYTTNHLPAAPLLTCSVVQSLLPLPPPAWPPYPCCCCCC